MLVVEVEGIDGALRRIELGDGSTQDVSDWRALVCDKAGVLPASTGLPTSPESARCCLRRPAAGSAFDAVLGADFAESILLRLSAHSLAQLSSASRRTREVAGRDLLWLAHLRRQFYKGAIPRFKASIRDARAWSADKDFVGYLTRMIALFRASEKTGNKPIKFGKVWDAKEEEGGHLTHSLGRTQLRGDGMGFVNIDVREGELRALFAKIRNEGCKVLKGWHQVCTFLPSGQLAEGLCDFDIWRLERELPGEREGFLLPFQLRQLHMLADGQSTGWSFADSGNGVINGNRWLPLAEVLDLWKQQQHAMENGERHSYGFGVELMPRARSTCCGSGDGSASLASGWLVPLTALNGFGDAGEWYGSLWPSGDIYKVSGLTHTYVGTVEDLLASLAR